MAKTDLFSSVILMTQCDSWWYEKH